MPMTDRKTSGTSQASPTQNNNGEAHSKSAETSLREHLASARERDLNPWIRGYDGELVSRLVVLHPEIGRSVAQEIALQNDGWMTADGLYHIAELAETKGAGLVEFSGLDRIARLLAVDPDSKDLPWQGLKRSGLSRPDSGSGIGLCPIWGPCNGHKRFLAEFLLDLAGQLEPECPGDFKIELMACDKDCQSGIAKSDLAVILDSESSFFSVWIGGRHRPFRNKIHPRHWMVAGLEELDVLLRCVFSMHDAWSYLAMGKETLPELASRLGLYNFSHYLDIRDDPAADGRPRQKEQEISATADGDAYDE